MHNLLVARHVHVIGIQIFISKKHFKIDGQARVGLGLVTPLQLKRRLVLVSRMKPDKFMHQLLMDVLITS